MRTLSGTGTLRTLLYMDEIFGFFPATSNPPSKNPMLLLLKQARAYGIGVVLSTQNPVDLDYKGLSNIGSWFIGRLQTKQDIDKVINGLIKSGTDALDKKRITDLLSNMKKRTFLLKSAHRDKIVLFGTRWVLSYLAGPLSKPQIKLLMKEKKEALKKQYQKKSSEKIDAATASTKSAPPPLSEDIDQYYLNNIEKECRYIPYLLANATIRYYNAKRAINLEKSFYYKYPLNERKKSILWKEPLDNDDDFDLYDINPLQNCKYAKLPTFISELKNLKPLEKEFANYLYHKEKLTLYRVEKLKLESKVNESLENFKIRIQDILKDKKEYKIENLKEKFGKKREILEKKLNRALEKLQKEEADVSLSTTNTVLSFGMTILDAFLGRSAIKRSTTAKAGSALKNAGNLYRQKDDVQRAQQRVDEIEEEIDRLQEELLDEIDKISQMYDIENFKIDPFYIKPRRSDIGDIEVALLWESI